MPTLDLPGAAKLLNMHPQTVLRMARAGNIPCAKPAKSWVFIESDLLDWIVSRDSILQTTQNIEPPNNWELLQQYAEAIYRIPTRIPDPQRTNIGAGKYHVYRSLATPAWLTYEHRSQIREMYRQTVGTGLSVDHVIPLRGRDVCGLHVPWNLRLIPIRENQRKNNTYVPVA